MTTTTRKIASIAGSALLAAGLASSVGAWARQGTAQRGHGGQGGHAGHAGGADTRREQRPIAAAPR
jgi:hypothetical protein